MTTGRAYKLAPECIIEKCVSRQRDQESPDLFGSSQDVSFPRVQKLYAVEEDLFFSFFFLASVQSFQTGRCDLDKKARPVFLFPLSKWICLLNGSGHSGIRVSPFSPVSYMRMISKQRDLHVKDCATLTISSRDV